ncbi:hypothetical protein [Bacteroides sp.]|uniref:hypothetical protein n=1 Tax=Bacteroides sp. TaxID=29523 RepID=UPI0026220535|nr:hypothetical protein [Bacteroides sp.]
MRIENVTFVEPAVKAMKKTEFIDKHMPVIWQDRSEDDRKKMLSDTYDLIKKGKVEEVKG